MSTTKPRKKITRRKNKEENKKINTRSVKAKRYKLRLKDD